jgi:Protein of unknown function (DUF4231)
MAVGPVLVDAQKLCAMIGDEPPEHQQYLRERWLHMVIWWDSRSSKAKFWYFALRGIVVFGGVLIPVLTVIQANMPATPRVVPVVIALVGAAIAGSAAWDGVQNFGDVWRDKRHAGEMLKVEGWLFMTKSGEYGDIEKAEQRFNKFVANVEAKFAHEVGDYLKSINQAGGKFSSSAAGQIS